jgi:hypothetical protein
MAIVPEGQADSSQARSAWMAMQRVPVPEGRSKSLSVPQIFIPPGQRRSAHRSASQYPIQALVGRLCSTRKWRVEFSRKDIKPWFDGDPDDHVSFGAKA